MRIIADAGHNEEVPQITFYNRAKTRSELIGVISISYEKDRAFAFIVIESFLPFFRKSKNRHNLVL